MTCTCNEKDGIYTIDGKEVSYHDWFRFCLDNEDWKTRTTSDMPADKRCSWCQGVAK